MGFGLIPDASFKKAADISPGWLMGHGVKGVIVDIDNTLGSYLEDVPARRYPIGGDLKKRGIKLALLSNNSEPRVKRFCEPLKARYAFRAGKPSRKGFLRLARELELDPGSLP
jgi:predicted HAD superfamily phosphohydrolase YqeG